MRLVSCKTGYGLSRLLGRARSMAEQRECDVYVVGAANAGKSTLINYILDVAFPALLFLALLVNLSNLIAGVFSSALSRM